MLVMFGCGDILKEDCCAATHLSGFKKIKAWGAIRCDKPPAGWMKLKMMVER